MADKQLKFTGERMIPEFNFGKSFYYEHIIRYLFASQFCNQKKVIDAACGTGYGSYILANTGKSSEVIGIDLSKKSIEYAKKNFLHKKIKFITKNILSLSSLYSKTFDIFVCFETLEHVKHQSLLLKNIKQLLNDSGILIISTPNTYNYHESNSFHQKELSPQDFETLLKKYFKNINIFSQKYFISQEINNLSKTNDSFNLINQDDFQTCQSKSFIQSTSINNSEYLIAVCSDTELSVMSNYKISLNKIENLDFTNGIQQHFSNLTSLFNNNDEYGQIKASPIYFLWNIYKSLKKLL